MSYIKYTVTVSKGQEDKLRNAVMNKKAVSLRLSKNNLVGTHLMLLTKAQINSIEKAKARQAGVTLKLSGKQVQANLKVEGGFLGMLLPFLMETVLPALTGTILPALGVGDLTGGASALASNIIESATGDGLKSQDGFFIKKDGKCVEGTYSGKGLYLSPSGYRVQHGDGLYLKSGGNVYEGGSILNQIPIIGPFLKLLGL